MIGPLWSNSGNARSRRHVTDELTHDSLVVWLKFSCYEGNGLKGLGAAEEIQPHFKHKQTHIAEFVRRLQNHYPRNVKASGTSPENLTSAPWLPASWNERSRSRPSRFKHLRRFFIFWFFEIHREIASVSNGSFRFESKSATNRQANRRHRELRFGVTPVMVLEARVNPAKRHGSGRLLLRRRRSTSSLQPPVCSLQPPASSLKPPASSLQPPALLSAETREEVVGG